VSSGPGPGESDPLAPGPHWHCQPDSDSESRCLSHVQGHGALWPSGSESVGGPHWQAQAGGRLWHEKVENFHHENSSCPRREMIVLLRVSLRVPSQVLVPLLATVTARPPGPDHCQGIMAFRRSAGRPRARGPDGHRGCRLTRMIIMITPQQCPASTVPVTVTVTQARPAPGRGGGSGGLLSSRHANCGRADSDPSS
jgi:hypothetical protein